MAPDPVSGRRSLSPEDSGRNSPIPRQWRNQLGGDDPLLKDKTYRRYAAGVDKALALFETALEEWADYISFLNRLSKALQARPTSITSIPSKASVAKRLSQCLNPSLPSGVHQKAVETYSYIFSTIGKDGLSRDLPLYLPGLASTLSFASLSVRSPFLDLLEAYFLKLDRQSLRPAMKSIILALLPGLEDETAEDFERTMKLMAKFKAAIRGADGELLTEEHSNDDDYFWQCFFLASITSHSRRAGALAYLVRYLPAQASSTAVGKDEAQQNDKLSAVVTTPEPGLLIRCFASGLSDEQLLIQRGFLDLLVTHLPLDCTVIQSKVKSSDLELLLRASVGVVTRREMSLNRRLWAWFLGPEQQSTDAQQGPESPLTPSNPQGFMNPRTTYFEEHGLQPLNAALLAMIREAGNKGATERARPYRICLSLMDRWEIGGLVVPEVFLPVIENVRQFSKQAASKAEFSEVLRSASVFFDGIESGLIYGELVTLLAQAIGPTDLTLSQRSDKLSLISFILANFNVREEEMITVHAPLSCLAALSMLEDSRGRRRSSDRVDGWSTQTSAQTLDIVASLLELVPERAFPQAKPVEERAHGVDSHTNVDILKRIQAFYIHEQGNIEAVPPPFGPVEIGELLLRKLVNFICNEDSSNNNLEGCVRILVLALAKAPRSYNLEVQRLLQFLRKRLEHGGSIDFSSFSSIAQLAIELYTAERSQAADISELVTLLVHNAWSFLAASEPKYHVETVRCLWQIQSSLPASNRDIEAALAGILVAQEVGDTATLRTVDKGRTFSILWSHTLQDNPSDRRLSRVAPVETRSGPRIAGMDHFDTMLTRPLLLVLDALFDETTPLYMTVRSWLNSMIGIDRLFLVFVHKFSEVRFLHDLSQTGGKDTSLSDSTIFTEEDDLGLCLYYLRLLSNMLRSSVGVSWNVLANKHLSFGGPRIHISSGGEESDMTLQDYFVRVCIKCITGDAVSSADEALDTRVAQLHRFALSLLHQFFLSPFAVPLSELNLENLFLDRLLAALDSSDSHVQVLLLDVVNDTLKLRDLTPAEPRLKASIDKRSASIDPSSRHSRPSISASEMRPAAIPPPPQLLKCLQAGLCSPNSRPVLDSWIGFLTEILPHYADTIFQVLIPLVETLCKQVSATFSGLRDTFKTGADIQNVKGVAPESTLIYLLNGLEQVLAKGHDQLLSAEARVQLLKNPDQPQSLFGSMVSGVFQSDAPLSRSATANDRLTVHLAFQDATRICYGIWSWGLGDEAHQQDNASWASFNHTCLRMRNRARRLLEQLFTAENLECLETVIDIWKSSQATSNPTEVFNLLSALEASRPRHSIPALFNSIYSRTNPGALEPSRKSTMTISLDDVTLVTFLVEYARSLDDDAMDEIWQDCMIFMKDILSNPFPHRQNLAKLLEFAAILGGKVDNTNFGEQRRMRRELGDLFLRLLAALFTTRPLIFSEPASSNGTPEKSHRNDGGRRSTALWSDGPEDIVAILASIVPNLQKILPEPDRVLSAAGTISTNVIGPTLRSKSFPETVSRSTLDLFRELCRLQNNQKTWKKDVAEAFNDPRFFGMKIDFVQDGWLPLLKQWTIAEKEKMVEIVNRINPPSTAGIVFGVGATSARLEADRKTQINLRRIATLVLASAEDAFVGDLPIIFDKLVELLAATSTSSPSSTTRGDVYMVLRALVLKTTPIHLALLWPVVNAEVHAALSSVVAPDHSTHSDVYTNVAVLQACKLIDLLICVAPDDFQLHEWLFVTDTIDAVYRSSSSKPVALADELSEELGSAAAQSVSHSEAAGHLTTSTAYRRPLIGGGINDDVSVERRDELVAKILRPFFGQLSIFAFESVYAMGALDWDHCVKGLLKDVFDERTIARAL